MNFALSLAGAILLALCFPDYNLTWLAPFALAPMVAASSREARGWRRFFAGWIAGFVYWFAVCNWIQFTLQTHGNMGAPMAWALFVLFCAAKGLHMAAFTWACGLAARSRWIAVPAAAALWVIIERLHAPLGFAWLMLGNAAIDWPLLPRVAPIAGVWGLSFLLALSSAAIAHAIVRRSLKPLAWLAIAPLLALLPAIPESRPTEQAVLVQPNISETAAWSEDLFAQTEQRLRDLSLAPFLDQQHRPSLLVWPEAPAPFYDTDNAFRSYTASIARQSHAFFLVGLVGHDGAASFNSAMVLDPEGNTLTRYDKVNLVPFGEFVPWPFNTFIEKISTETGDFARGHGTVVTPIGPHRLSTFICYESVFPDFIRQSVRAGAGLLLNPSNDGWFGKSAAREQHLEIVRMRALENRRWILRATNDGVTASIDPRGRVIKRLSSFEELTARMPFAWESDTTLYTRFGDWFVWFCLFLVAASFTRKKIPRP